MKCFFQSMFSKEAINTGRQSELDWFKAFAIMWMVQCHVEEVIFSRFWEDRAFVSGSMLLLIPMLIGISSWAFGFMFSMGTTIVYSHSSSPDGFVSRGFRLLAAWLVLRLLYIFPLAVHFAPDSGVSVFRYAAKYLLSSDILCFAGLFFIYYGFLLKRAAAHSFTHIYIYIYWGSFAAFVRGRAVYRMSGVRHNCRYLRQFYALRNKLFPVSLLAPRSAFWYLLG